MSKHLAKILIVDDSEILRLQLRSVLESSNFDIVEACSGKMGLEKLQSESEIALIICDVNMPEMDGLTMCEHLQAQKDIQKPHILMLTTESSNQMKVRGKDAGVRAWVTKPFNPDKLIPAIKKILNLPV